MTGAVPHAGSAAGRSDARDFRGRARTNPLKDLCFSMKQRVRAQQTLEGTMVADVSSSPAARIAGVQTILLGLLELVAWVLGIPSLKSVDPARS